MNKKLRDAGKKMLKELLDQCTEDQQLTFKRMYGHKTLDLNIHEVVDNMEDDNIDWAITQCERTVSDNKAKDLINTSNGNSKHSR